MNSLNERTLSLVAEGVEDGCLDRRPSASYASSTPCSSKIIVGRGKPLAALTPAELRKWRAGYRAYLESRGVPPEGAADMAAKVAYRADLYPAPGITPDLFQLTPVARANKPAVPTDNTNEDNLSAKGKSAEAQLLAPIRRKPKTTSPTPREARLVKTAVEIAAERPSGDDLAFMHAIMCQVGLPRSKIDSREFLRKSGDFWLYVQAGMIDEGAGPVPQPVPYGPLPRLALVWLPNSSPHGHSNPARTLRAAARRCRSGTRSRRSRRSRRVCGHWGECWSCHVAPQCNERPMPSRRKRYLQRVAYPPNVGPGNAVLVPDILHGRRPNFLEKLLTIE